MKKLLMTLGIVACMVVPMTGAATGHAADDDMVSSVTTAAPEIKTVAEGIELTVTDGEVHHFYIYSITGQMVKSVDVAESAVIDLPQGYYIVKCKEWSKKIVVR